MAAGRFEPFGGDLRFDGMAEDEVALLPVPLAFLVLDGATTSSSSCCVPLCISADSLDGLRGEVLVPSAAVLAAGRGDGRPSPDKRVDLRGLVTCCGTFERDGPPTAAAELVTDALFDGCFLLFLLLRWPAATISLLSCSSRS